MFFFFKINIMQHAYMRATIIYYVQCSPCLHARKNKKKKPNGPKRKQ